MTGELEVAQEKMVAKEEALKKREAELTSAKVSISIKKLKKNQESYISMFLRLPSPLQSKSWRRRRRC